MRIPRLPGSRSGCPVGSHAWMLIAMFQLAMDLTACESAAGGQGLRLAQRPSPRHRLPRGPWWSPKSGQELRMPGPAWTPVSAHPDRPHGLVQRYRPRRPPRAAEQPPGPPAGRAARARRHLRGGASRPGGGRATAVPEVIVWGPTGEEDSLETSTLPGRFGPAAAAATTAAAWQAGATAGAAPATAAPATAAPPPRRPPATPVPAGDARGSHPGRGSTTEPYGGSGKEARPPRVLGDTSGLAVHQIITITVSLIMVIAALITTLVLKNCCVQSGNTRRNSHQRKINQQEESCQNLTDFTPARVPSSLDIFTAYNETLQCSHECVRTPVPVYTEEALHSPGDYKTTFNGNRIPLVNL
ncbi:adherens junction-associated protein 1 isoform X2 [Dromaius novaehollandiae]|uniref:adherens junction-associated protein 1 isoform X2 n=1 Tax=Dromaius novaehollandiae TaxID=8790 RepID=UPI00311DAA5D